jgi:hypothetical protein
MQRGHLIVRAVQPRYESPFEALAAAALAYADTDTGDDESYKRASIRLRMAALRFARGRR